MRAPRFLAFAPLLLALCLPLGSAWAKNLLPTPQDHEAALRIERLPSNNPIDRLVQILSSLEFSDGALFVLAGPEPILVEQILNEKNRIYLDYLAALPATDLSDLRSGRTVVRTKEGWSKRETEKLIVMAERLGIKKPKKLESIRIGVIPGLKVQVELVGKKGSAKTELAYSTTPEREERARDTLTAYFGARPLEITSGPGSKIPLEDCSFEKKESLGTDWQLSTLVEKGSPLPLAEVALDRDVVIDGRSSLRFHSDDESRSWLGVSQSVTVSPDMPVVLRGHYKIRNVRRERDQQRIFHARMLFTDSGGNPVGSPITEEITLMDTDWREFVLRGTVPQSASYVRVEIACTMSGTAWFDAFSMTVGF